MQYSIDKTDIMPQNSDIFTDIHFQQEQIFRFPVPLHGYHIHSSLTTGHIARLELVVCVFMCVEGGKELKGGRGRECKHWSIIPRGVARFMVFMVEC